MKKIAFLGPKGTFSHEALLMYLKDRDMEPIAASSIPELIFGVYEDRYDEAIVPIENSLEGGVNATIDLLANDVDLHITAEVIIRIEENLLVRKGTKKENIKKILSHPQPIGQCRKYLNDNFPGVEVEGIYSTAGAAIEVTKCDYDMAAIGSHTAADVYNLEIMDRSVQDNKNNMTRFIIISKEEGMKTGDDKTSIVFSTDNKPGSLYRILDIFNLWDINMTRIESRPAKYEFGKYIFIIDIKGHMDDPDIKDALTMVRRKTTFFKLLGSFHNFGDLRV
jgi:prephenate dehydratase